MIGRAWSVKIRRLLTSDLPTLATEWKSGTAYEYGMLPPRYPMPAIDYYHSTLPEHVRIGNVMELSHSEAEIEQVLVYHSDYR